MVWHRHLTTPLCAVTMLKLVGSATIAASGARGNNSAAVHVPAVAAVLSLSQRCQRVLSARDPENPHSSLTVNAIAIVGRSERSRTPIEREMALNIAAIEPFTSQAPRPYTRPLTTSAPNGSI